MSEMGGVDAGPLYVDVIADTTGFGRDLQAKINAETARVKADIQATIDARKAEAQLAAIERKQRQVALGVTVDDAKAQAQLDAVAAKQRVATVRADADTAPAQAKLDKLAATQRTASIKAAVEDAEAQAKLQAIEAKRRVAEIKAEADTINAERKLDQAARNRTAKIDVDTSELDKVGQQIGGLGTGALSLLQMPAIAAGISMAAGALAQVAAGLFAVVAAAAPAVGVLGAIPGLVSGAAQGIGSIIVGFMGVGAAVKASGASEAAAAAQSSQASAQRAAAAQRIVAAQDRIRQTQTALANTEANAARQIQQAQQGVADAHTQAARAVQQAEGQLAQSQRDATQAQLDLIAARERATRQLQDLNAQLAGGRLSVEQAQIDVQRAGDTRTKVFASPKSTELDKHQADLSYREAIQNLKDQQREQQRLEQDTARANKAGVEGSAVVVQAKQRVVDTNAKVVQSEQAVRDAEIQGAQKIAKAEATLANARRTAAFSVQSAQHQVLLAQRALADAQANASLQTSKQTTASTALAAALSQLSPAGQRFVRFLRGTLQPAWLSLQKTVQQALLPPVQRGLTALLPLLTILQTGMVRTAAILGGAFQRLATQYLATPIFKRDLATILGNNNRAFATLSGALIPIVRALTDVTVAAGPLLQRFAQFIASGAQMAGAFISAQRASGGLARFFQQAGDTAGQLWRIVRDLVIAILNIGKAAMPAGRTLLASFEGVVAKWREWTGSMQGQNTLRDYFNRAIPIMNSLGRLIHDVVVDFFKLGNNAQFAGLIDMIRTQALPAILRLGQTLNGAFGPALVKAITDVINLIADLAGGGGGGALTSFVNTLDSIVQIFDRIARSPVGGWFLRMAASIAGTGAALALLGGPLLRVGGMFAKFGGFAAGFVKVARGAEVAEKGITRLGGQVASKVIPAIRGIGTAALWVGRAFLASGPWGWIILGITALVTGFIVAYKTSATFRNIVNGALQAVGKAALWLWRNAIIPAFNAIRVAMSAVGRAASWLWTNAIRPAFTAIGTFVAWWWKNVTRPVLAALISFIRQVIWPTVQWLYTHVFRPYFALIGAYIRLWWAAVQIEFKAVVWFIQHVLAPVIAWLWRNVVVPYFKSMANTIKGVVAVITGIINGLNWFLRRVVGPTIAWLFNNVVKPYFTSIGNTVSFVWNRMISPAFNAIKTGLGKVADAFRSGVGKIKQFWNGLKSAVTAPVRFVIDTIYNNGIRGFWNAVASKVGLPLLNPPLHIKGINAARGAVVPGYAPGVDVVPATLSPGEGVLVPEAVRGLARAFGTTSDAAIQTINSAFSSRVAAPSGATRRRAASGLPGYDIGGIVGWVGDQIGSGASAAASYVADKLGKSKLPLTKAVVGNLSASLLASSIPLHALINRVLPSSPALMNLFRTGSNNLVDKAVDKIVGRDRTVNATQGVTGSPVGNVGSGVSRWTGFVLKALSMNGLSSLLLGRVLKQMQTESGGNPNIIQQIHDVNSGGNEARGLMQVIPPTFRAYHFPGTSWNIFDPLANIAAALRYAKARYGPSLSFLGQGHGYGLGGVVSSVLGKAARLFDSGGVLRPGVSLAVNGTGADEYVLTGSQWDTLATLAASAAASAAGLKQAAASDRAGVEQTFHIHPAPGMDVKDLAREVAVEVAWQMRGAA